MAHDSERPAITVSLVSHTNVGKTTLARTLLRRDVGEVLDQAHVTEVAEAHTLIETGDGELRLWDTPGFGDSVRLLARLEKHDRPIVWLLRQVWDRFTDRPLWCSQQAVLNIREEADVVLYLVNAMEEPEDAGYVLPELALLEWVGKPVVVVLNQTGDVDAGSDLMRLRIDVWRRHLARFSVVRDFLALDAFSRCWVQEGELFARIEPLLDDAQGSLMRRLRTAWIERNLRIFASSVGAMSAYLARAAGDREGLPSRRPTKAEKELAWTALGERLDRTTGELTRTLLAAHDLVGDATAAIERQIDAIVVAGEDRIDPERGALLGGVLSGAVGGLTADLMAGGFTFGGGLLAGAILGALGGAGLARGYQLVTAGKKPAVAWSPEFLNRLAERTLLRYLAIAHFGRGRGEFRPDEEEPSKWRAQVKAVLERDAAGWTETWKSLARQARPRPAGVRQGDFSSSAETVRFWLDRALRAVLGELYPAFAGLVAPPQADDGPRRPS